MTQAEQAKASSISHALVQLNYVAAHLLLAWVRLFFLNDLRWQLHYSARGCPYLQHPERGRLGCSITHAQGWAGVLVLPAAVRGGIDIEQGGRFLAGQRRRILGALAARERRLLQHAGDGEAFAQRFAALWCLKEASAKAWGKPLRAVLGEDMHDVVWRRDFRRGVWHRRPRLGIYSTMLSAAHHCAIRLVPGCDVWVGELGLFTR